MLELLAGPFPVVDAEGAPVNISEGRFGQTALYDDATGLASYSSTLSGFVITQMDGVTHLRAAQPGAHAYALDLPGNGWLLIGAFNAELHEMNKATGVRGRAVFTGLDTNAVIDILARTPDRFLAVDREKVQNRPLDLSGGFADECTLTGPPVSGTSQATLSRTKNPDVLCITYETGQVVHYDYVQQEQVGGTAYLPANYGAWYSPKHDVFVVLTGTTDNAVSIYANAAEPYTMTDPAASPSLTRGRRSAISVTVTGANGEACRGELIDWTLDGPGVLLASQSETDEQGVAIVGYVAPLDASVPATFTATLVR